MRFLYFLGLSLLCAGVSVAQVQPSTTEIPSTEYANDRMLVPPPLSGQSYPSLVGAEERSNYMSFGLSVDAAYDDNVLTGQVTKPISDTTYTFAPTFLYDRSDARQKETFIYSPGFTIFQHTSSLNAIDQNANLAYQYRISPYVAILLGDSFVQTSNMFGNSLQATQGGGATGAPSSPNQAVIVPYAAEILNTGKGTLTYQFELNDMVGGSGTVNVLHFPNPNQSLNLYDANTYEGTAFYSHRLSGGQYLGVSYDYTKVVASPTGIDSEAQTQAVVPFYTFYIGPRFSLSLTGGPEHYDVTQTNLPTQKAWTPVASGTLGWQRERTNLTVGYARTVTAGGGLLGAFKSDHAIFSGRWKMTRDWTVGVNGDYAQLKALTDTGQSSVFFNPGGHRITGTALVQRPLGEKFQLEAGYDRLHQSYSSIEVIAANPDSDRVYGMITYRFRKSLGR